MPIYAPKYQEIEARQFRIGDAAPLADWCRGRIPNYREKFRDQYIEFGNYRAHVGDYIVKAGKDFIAVPKETFERNYELVREVPFLKARSA